MDDGRVNADKYEEGKALLGMISMHRSNDMEIGMNLFFVDKGLFSEWEKFCGEKKCFEY